jgi:hypothetical protein
MMLMVGASLFPPYPTMRLSGRMGHPAVCDIVSHVSK